MHEAPDEPPFEPHFRALRCGPDRVVLGIAARHPQILTDLSERSMEELLRLPALPAHRWPQVFRRSGDRRLTALLRTAVERLGAAPVQGLRVEVDGDGVVAREIGRLVRDLGAVPGATPDVRVVVGGVVDPGEPRAALTLPVEVGSDQIVVGPLLRIGDGPCPGCLHLRRTDQFPAWPLVLTQLRAVRLADVAPGTAPELSRMASALVGLVLRGIAAGRPLPPGMALAVATPEPVVEHRFWPVHPRCDCSRAYEDDWGAAG